MIFNNNNNNNNNINNDNINIKNNFIILYILDILLYHIGTISNNSNNLNYKKDKNKHIGQFIKTISLVSRKWNDTILKRIDFLNTTNVWFAISNERDIQQYRYYILKKNIQMKFSLSINSSNNKEFLQSLYDNVISVLIIDKKILPFDEFNKNFRTICYFNLFANKDKIKYMHLPEHIGDQLTIDNQSQILNNLCKYIGCFKYFLNQNLNVTLETTLNFKSNEISINEKFIKDFKFNEIIIKSNFFNSSRTKYSIHNVILPNIDYSIKSLDLQLFTFTESNIQELTIKSPLLENFKLETKNFIDGLVLPNCLADLKHLSKLSFIIHHVESITQLSSKHLIGFINRSKSIYQIKLNVGISGISNEIDDITGLVITNTSITNCDINIYSTDSRISLNNIKIIDNWQSSNFTSLSFPHGLLPSFTQRNINKFSNLKVIDITTPVFNQETIDSLVMIFQVSSYLTTCLINSKLSDGYLKPNWSSLFKCFNNCKSLKRLDLNCLSLMGIEGFNELINFLNNKESTVQYLTLGYITDPSKSSLTNDINFINSLINNKSITALDVSNLFPNDDYNINIDILSNILLNNTTLLHLSIHPDLVSLPFSDSTDQINNLNKIIKENPNLISLQFDEHSQNIINDKISIFSPPLI